MCNDIDSNKSKTSFVDKYIFFNFSSKVVFENQTSHSTYYFLQTRHGLFFDDCTFENDRKFLETTFDLRLNRFKIQRALHLSMMVFNY